MSGAAKLFGALETGGTTTRVAVGSADGGFAAREAFPTHGPAETVQRVADFLRRHPIAALGVAAFGPIDVDPNSPRFGTLLETPKDSWSRFPLRAELLRTLGAPNLPVFFETDVNAAALAEQRAALRAGVDATTLAYVTVGTGIGGGVALAGRAHHGALHPEAGHLRVQRAQRDDFAGVCPFHRDCLEGLASGPALAGRFGADAATVPPDHDLWRIEADYLAQLVLAIVGLLAPQQIVLGGGVMQTSGLLERVRARATELANGYSPLLKRGGDAGAAALLVAPRLGRDSGLLGALQIAAPTAPTG